MDEMEPEQAVNEMPPQQPLPPSLPPVVYECSSSGGTRLPRETLPNACNAFEKRFGVKEGVEGRPRRQHRHTFDKDAYEAFQLPDDARWDLNKDTYLQREALRNPELRRLVPPALRQRRKLPKAQVALATSQGCTNVRSARQYIKSYGYLHGIGREPEDLGDEWANNIFTPSKPGSKPQVWHPESSDSESDIDDAQSEASDKTWDNEQACTFGDDGPEPEDNEPTPLQLDAVLEGGHAPLDRFVGSCRVELHSLQRSELNGRCGVIVDAPPPPRARAGGARWWGAPHHGEAAQHHHPAACGA